MDNPKNFRKFKKLPFILSILFLAASLAALFFLLREIRENKKLSAEARTAWQEEAARRHELRSLDLLFQDTVAERSLIDTHFAGSSNIVPFLDSLEDLARAVNARAEVTSVDAGDLGDPKRDSPELLVDVQADGTFESLYKFLELLENSPYELEFRTVEMKARDEAGSSVWEASFEMKLLSFIP